MERASKYPHQNLASLFSQATNNVKAHILFVFIDNEPMKPVLTLYDYGEDPLTPMLIQYYY